MFFDLNVPVSDLGLQGSVHSKKSKGKQPQQLHSVAFTLAQIKAIETRVDLLVHLGYAVIAFNQTVDKRLDPKSHVNILDSLLPQIRKRTGVIFLKRLTITLDEDSEKGFGLTNANASLVEPYDLIALTPTTATTFSLACLTHTLPSSLTAHVISLPLTLPRLPFHLKHTLVRTALKNGAVFEINYAGAIGGDGDTSQMNHVSGESGKRNWWAAAREVVRVTKGKGIIVSGGVVTDADHRAPKDVGNLISLLGLARNIAHDASASVPKSLVLRAQTRRTYRAVLSEPRLVVPNRAEEILDPAPTPQPTGDARDEGHSVNLSQVQNDSQSPPTSSENPAPHNVLNAAVSGNRKRSSDQAELDLPTSTHHSMASLGVSDGGEASQKKKKKNKNKEKAGGNS
ncbi:PHP domain-like protein [Leucogyrophana mollusca]|uniref:PHP domain-like protein n=1 Tax=Leucogyrophana mollusca TaxID=85980 RepID=A0ACB8BV47_9AGAM|nr:PHP domain-like protein [Leucogyrophana mollusca]